MFVKELVLKSGRKVEFRELSGKDNMNVITILGSNIPESNVGAGLAMAYAKSGLSVIRYQKKTTGVQSDTPIFDDTMHIRHEFKVYKDLENFWSFFSDSEQEEMVIYWREMNSEDTPVNKEEVEDLTEDATQGKY